jgi:hypothetical protein
MMASNPPADPVQARRFLKVLADGVPPKDELIDWLTVGEEHVLRRFSDDLSAVAQGDSRNLLVLGNPGAGKSHLLTILEFRAAHAGFVTTYFSQDIQSRVAFNRPDQIYSRITETMQLTGSLSDTYGGIQEIMRRWADQALPKLRGVNRSMQIAFALSEQNLLPTDTLSIHPRTRVAVVGYLMAVEQQNEAAVNQFLSVLRGPGLESGKLMQSAQSIRLERKAFIGYTPSVYDSAYYFGQLSVLVFIIRAIGLKGLVTLFDEITAIVDLRARSREKAYKVLDSFFDNAHAGLYSVFAYMPPFLTQLQSDARNGGSKFAERWHKLSEGAAELSPLTCAQLMELFRRIAVLYGIAYEWNGGDNMTAEAIRLANGCEKRNVPVRDFVRRALLLLEQRRSATVP